MTWCHEMALIEAILLLESEPVSLNRLAKTSGFQVSLIQELLTGLKDRYDNEEACGLTLVIEEECYALAPKETLWKVLQQHYGKKMGEKLSRAAMETLAIIAYTQPVTRAEIEAIRGVFVDGVLQLLLKKKLIEGVGKREILGRPIQYGTSKEFLKHFRLRSIADLPKLSEREHDRFSLDG